MVLEIFVETDSVFLPSLKPWIVFLKPVVELLDSAPIVGLGCFAPVGGLIAGGDELFYILSCGFI
jgi:hypothetical protein